MDPKQIAAILQVGLTALNVYRQLRDEWHRLNPGTAFPSDADLIALLQSDVADVDAQAEAILARLRALPTE